MFDKNEAKEKLVTILKDKVGYNNAMFLDIQYMKDNVINTEVVVISNIYVDYNNLIIEISNNRNNGSYPIIEAQLNKLLDSLDDDYEETDVSLSLFDFNNIKVTTTCLMDVIRADDTITLYGERL